MSNFFERAPEMGLKLNEDGTAAFHYGEYCDVAYVQIQLKKNEIVDDEDLFNYAVFVRNKSALKWLRASTSYLSDNYKFTPFEDLVKTVRNNIVSSESLRIATDAVLLGTPPSCMRYILSVDNRINTVDDGVYINPIVIAESSYDGTRANSVMFGVSIDMAGVKMNLPLRDSIGTIRNIHTKGSTIGILSKFGEFSTQFNNVSECINTSFKEKIGEKAMIETMEFLSEKIGTKKTSKITEDCHTEADGSPVTLWNVFRALMAYTAEEGSLNYKKYIESTAEKLLNFPVVLNKILY